jgi:hypothetical protein
MGTRKLVVGLMISGFAFVSADGAAVAAPGFVPPENLGGASFTATATDMWGPVTLSWSFGGGGAGTGGTTTHAFAAPGTKTVTVTAADAVGNTATRTGTITIAANAPALSSVSVTHEVFRVGNKPTAITAQGRERKHRPPIGTTFIYTLSEPASVTIRITHGAPGRRSGGKCLKPTRKLRTHKRCTRRVVNGTLHRSGKAGVNRIPFSGRIARKPLAPGSYKATLTATAFRLASRPRTMNFRIVR